nr:hypothetical protein [uncultured Ottowia sp.]
MIVNYSKNGGENKKRFPPKRISAHFVTPSPVHRPRSSRARRHAPRPKVIQRTKAAIFKAQSCGAHICKKHFCRV